MKKNKGLKKEKKNRPIADRLSCLRQYLIYCEASRLQPEHSTRKRTSTSRSAAELWFCPGDFFYSELYYPTISTINI
ncbi:hypothetical protein SDJN02_15977, partial [Cucurbita argyrosperma subsp. argyrosperma]